MANEMKWIKCKLSVNLYLTINRKLGLMESIQLVLMKDKNSNDMKTIDGLKKSLTLFPNTSCKQTKCMYWTLM